jgi:hypothetical protein
MMSPKSRADRVIHDLRRPGRNARRDHRQQEGLHRRLDAEIPVGHELAGVVHSAVFPLNGELCSHADHQVEKEKFDRDAQRPTEVALAEAPGEPGSGSRDQRRAGDAGDVAFDQRLQQDAGDDREADQNHDRRKQK